MYWLILLKCEVATYNVITYNELQMDSENRHYLVCPKCRRVSNQLTMHLNRWCMRDDTDERRKEVCTEALNMVLCHAVIPFHSLESDFSSDIDLGVLREIVQAFERRGHYVTGQPPSIWWARTTGASKYSASKLLSESWVNNRSLIFCIFNIYNWVTVYMILVR